MQAAESSSSNYCDGLGAHIRGVDRLADRPTVGTVGCPATVPRPRGKHAYMFRVIPRYPACLRIPG